MKINMAYIGKGNYRVFYGNKCVGSVVEEAGSFRATAKTSNGQKQSKLLNSLEAGRGFIVMRLTNELNQTKN